MLVLRRLEGESVFIGDDIEITVVRIDRASVKFGVRAPKGMPIVRSELKEQWNDDERLAKPETVRRNRA